MSLHHSPRIVTDNLKICLDASNPKSYPGSGAEWYDLSGNKFHMSLKNSPTFNSNGILKYFSLVSTSSQYGVCDGLISGSAAAYVNNLQFNNTNPKTVVCIARMPSTVSNGSGGLFDIGDAGVAGQHFCLRVASTTPTTWRAQFWGTPDYDFNYDARNIWTMFSITYGDDKIGRTYGNNGTLLGQDASAFDLVTNGVRPFEMGRYNTNNYIDADIALYLVYSKSLTVAEIQQNYNALKGRFGL